MDEVSSRGFALAYIGSTIPFALSIGLIVLAQYGLIPVSVSASGRIAFLLTAFWCLVFSFPMIKHVKQIHYVEREPEIVKNSF